MNTWIHLLAILIKMPAIHKFAKGYRELVWKKSLTEYS